MRDEEEANVFLPQVQALTENSLMAAEDIRIPQDELG